MRLISCMAEANTSERASRRSTLAVVAEGGVKIDQFDQEDHAVVMSGKPLPGRKNPASPDGMRCQTEPGVLL